MSNSFIDKKLLWEEDLLSWVCDKHIQVFGTNPSKNIKIISGFLHKNSFLPMNPYELVINHATKGFGSNEKTIIGGHVFLSKEEILQEWTLCINQQDYEVFMHGNETERINDMHLQKADYIVQVQYPKGNYNDEKWSPSNFTSTLSSLSKNEFYEKIYNYAVPNGMSLRKGDYVLVGRTDNTMAVVKVVGIVKDTLKNMEEINKAINYVYGKVNLDAIVKQIETAERAKYLKNKIDELKRTFEERKMLEIMAQNDPEAAKIINEYKDLVQFLPK